MDLFEHGIFGDIKPDIVERFIEYHKANPAVYDEFRKFAFHLRDAGRSHFGAKAIIERIRYETAIRGNDDFKINNSFASCYARLMIFDCPGFDGFFETRRTSGSVEAAA